MPSTEGPSTPSSRRAPGQRPTASGRGGGVPLREHLPRVISLGRIPYVEALALQRDLARRRQAGEGPDMVLLCEHPPVVTLGRASKPEHLLASRDDLARLGIEVVPVERGGDVTYHGPGQLVGYPVLDLRGHGQDLHRYLRDLEEVLIGAAAAFGVEASRVPGKTGVWAGDRKLASIGIHVSRWVTWHGFALNVTREALQGFDLMVPCGLAGVTMTALEVESGRAVTVAEAAEVVTALSASAFTPRREFA